MSIMEKVKKYGTRAVLVVGLSAIALGCADVRTTYSKVKEEKAVVSEKYHRGAWMQPVRVGKVTSFITHPAIHRVSFDGKVDFDVRSVDLYNSLEEKDTVYVQYREVYKDLYEDKDDDGISTFVKRDFDGYKFVDAKKYSGKSYAEK